MKHIMAIDIVLLPPQEIWDWAFSLSQEINKGIKKPEILLNHTHLPHITLAMAFIHSGDFDKVFNLTEKLAGEFHPLQLTAQEVIMDGSKAIGLDIKKTDYLQTLHETIIDSIKEYEQKSSPDAFLFDKGEAIRPLTMDWVENFRKNAGYVNYGPHITLGKNEVFLQIKPREFIATRLAICHLGNYCTCRKIIKEWKLL